MEGEAATASAQGVEVMLVSMHHPLCPKARYEEPHTTVVEVVCECPQGWPRLSRGCCGGTEKRHVPGCLEEGEEGEKG